MSEKAKKPVGTIILISALVTAIGGIAETSVPYLFESKSPTEQERSSVTRKAIDPEKEEADESSQSGDVKSGWIQLAANTVYKSESNGFVAAYTSGPNEIVARGGIEEGPSQDRLVRRVRFKEWDGAVLPVHKGRYWSVVANRGHGENAHLTQKGVVVQWLSSP